MKQAAFLAAVAAALLAAPSGTVQAESLSFKIKNTSRYIISSFQTNEGHGWSKNWLRSEVGSGEARSLEFLRDGPCDIQVRVGWRTTDGGQETGDPWNIDICDAQTVFFDGRKVTYE